MMEDVKIDELYTDGIRINIDIYLNKYSKRPLFGKHFYISSKT